MPFLFWFVAFLVFVVMEAASLALTAVWFAGGALAAFFAAVCGGGFRLQLIIFTVISALLLACVRPFARKFVNRGTQKTKRREPGGETCADHGRRRQCQVDWEGHGRGDGVDSACQGSRVRVPCGDVSKDRGHSGRQADRHEADRRPTRPGHAKESA